MRREWRLASFMMLLFVHPVVMGSGSCEDVDPVANQKACDVFVDLPGLEKTSEVEIPPGGFALVRFSCPDLNQGARAFEFVDTRDESKVEPVAQVFDHPLGLDRTDYVVLFRDVGLVGSTAIGYRVFYDHTSCEHGPCVGSGEIPFKLSSELTAESESRISLAAGPDGRGVKVTADIAEGRFAWIGEGLVLPSSRPLFTPVEGASEDHRLDPNFNSDPTSFIDFPLEPRTYRMVTMVESASGLTYDVGLHEIEFTPLKVEIEASPSGTVEGAETAVDVPMGSNVVLTAKVVGGLLEEGQSYRISWQGLPAGVDPNASTVSFPANSDRTLTLEVSDSMENSAVATAEIRIMEIPVGNHRLTIQTAGLGTVTTQPSGINCGSACSALYPEGTTVVLQAQGAAAGRIEFQGCQVNSYMSSGDFTSVEVVMDQDQLCQVSFPEISTTKEVFCEVSPRSSAAQGEYLTFSASVSGFEATSFEWNLDGGRHEFATPNGDGWIEAGQMTELGRVAFYESGVHTVTVHAFEGMSPTPITGTCSITIQ